MNHFFGLMYIHKYNYFKLICYKFKLLKQEIKFSAICSCVLEFSLDYGSFYVPMKSTRNSLTYYHIPKRLI